MLISNKAILYEAFKAKDSRFDGWAFIAIYSTGIYCRPICGARMPKFKNCTFIIPLLKQNNLDTVHIFFANLNSLLEPLFPMQLTICFIGLLDL